MAIRPAQVKQAVDKLVASLDDSYGVPEATVEGIGALITQVYGANARKVFRDSLQIGACDERLRYWIAEDQAPAVLLSIKEVDSRNPE